MLAGTFRNSSSVFIQSLSAPHRTRRFALGFCRVRHATTWRNGCEMFHARNSSAILLFIGYARNMSAHISITGHGFSLRASVAERPIALPPATGGGAQCPVHINSITMAASISRRLRQLPLKQSRTLNNNLRLARVCAYAEAIPAVYLHPN